MVGGVGLLRSATAKSVDSSAVDIDVISAEMQSSPADAAEIVWHHPFLS